MANEDGRRTGALSVARLFRAARYSLAGLRDATRLHPSFRLEVALAAALTPVALWLGDGGVQWALMLGSLLLVLILELVNSAVETAVDRMGTEPNELSRQAKDIASAAVLLGLLNVPLVWGLVLLS